MSTLPKRAARCVCRSTKKNRFRESFIIGLHYKAIPHFPLYLGLCIEIQSIVTSCAGRRCTFVTSRAMVTIIVQQSHDHYGYRQ